MIETYHLSKLYNRGVYALRDLTLTVDKGEFIFLTGPSGAGKSTLLRLLLREDLPSEGELKVLHAYYQRLTGAGKLPKVALVACMRKLLATLNATVKNHTRWDPEYGRV